MTPIDDYEPSALDELFADSFFSSKSYSDEELVELQSYSDRKHGYIKYRLNPVPEDPDEHKKTKDLFES